MDAIFSGLKPAVVAIIFHALWSVGRKALHTVSHYILAGLAFASIFFFNISMPYIILGTIVSALILMYFWPSLVYKGKAQESHESLNEDDHYISGSGRSDP